MLRATCIKQTCPERKYFKFNYFCTETALYEKSNETKEHTDRVLDLSIKLGKSVGLSSSQLDELSLLASLHDIGKVAMPETILAKEGKLTKEEWEVIKRHPEIGFNIANSSPQIPILQKQSFPAMKTLTAVVIRWELPESQYLLYPV